MHGPRRSALHPSGLGNRESRLAAAPAALALAVALAVVAGSGDARGDEIRVQLLTGSYVRVLGPSDPRPAFWLYALLVDPAHRPIRTVGTRCRALPVGERAERPGGEAGAGGELDLCHGNRLQPAERPARKSRVYRLALQIPPAYLGEILRRRFTGGDFVRIVGFRLTEAGSPPRPGLPAALSFALEIGTDSHGILSSARYLLEPIAAGPAESGMR